MTLAGVLFLIGGALLIGQGATGVAASSVVAIAVGVALFAFGADLVTLKWRARRAHSRRHG